MSKASEYALKMKEIFEKRKLLVEPREPESFSIYWPGGGRKIAKVIDTGEMIADNVSLSQEDALRLRDWIDDNFGDGVLAERSVLQKAIVKIKDACDPSKSYESMDKRWEDVNSALKSWEENVNSCELGLPPQWLPRSAHSGMFFDGDRYLVALLVVDSSTEKEGWEFYIIRAMCGQEEPLHFVKDGTGDADSGEAFTEWEWDDIEYYIPLGRGDG